jgi:hypothetical protein
VPEAGLNVEPYGIDLSPGLVSRARSRLPQWSERIWVGNAVDWVHPDGCRFDYVHTLVDCVPANRRHAMVEHQLRHLVGPGGRLLVSHFLPPTTRIAFVAEELAAMGCAVAGTNNPSGGAWPHTAWLGAGTTTGWPGWQRPIASNPMTGSGLPLHRVLCNTLRPPGLIVCDSDPSPWGTSLDSVRIPVATEANGNQWPSPDDDSTLGTKRKTR